MREDRAGRPVVPLWANRDGTEPLGNPIKADELGKFGFYAKGGSYYIRVFTGPSQQPFQQYVRRHQAIGTAAERDVEDLATALETGTATFPTLAELQAFVPSGQGVGGKVTTGPEAGFYHRNWETNEWVFDRPLFDTLARMVVTGGTADASEAATETGVADSAVVMLWIEAPATNTGPVTINGKPVLTIDGAALLAGQWLAGRTYWFTNEGEHYKLRTESDVSGLVAQAEAAATVALDAAGVAAGAAGASANSAAEAAGFAAGLNLPPILAGDFGKHLTVNVGEEGYVLVAPPPPPVRGGVVVPTVAELKVLDVSTDSAFLSAADREGQFIWMDGDYAARIAADTASGVFAKADDVAANLGAWVRQFDGPVHATWFGTSLQVAINVAAMLNKSLYLGEKGSTFTITADLTIPDDLMVFSQLFGGAGAKIYASSGNFTAVALGQRAKLVGIEIEGPGNDAYNADSFGIFQTGTNNAPAAPTYVDGPTIDNCYIHGFRNAGIELRYVRNRKIRNSLIERCGYAGIADISAMSGEVTNTHVDDISPGVSSNAYGMFFSKHNGDQVAYPNSQDVAITRCEVRNVPLWHGFDTHGGRGIRFIDCVARNCRRGVFLTFASNATTGAYGPKRCLVENFQYLEPATTKTARAEAVGIIGAQNGSGAFVDYADDCVVTNLFADGAGSDASGGSGGAINIGGTRRLILRDINLLAPIGRGILFDKENLEFRIAGLTITDLHSNFRATIALLINGSNNKGRIRDYNILTASGPLGTYNNDIGVYTGGALTALQVSLSSGRNLATTPTSYTTPLSAYDV